MYVILVFRLWLVFHHSLMSSQQLMQWYRFCSAASLWPVLVCHQSVSLDKLNVTKPCLIMRIPPAATTGNLKIKLFIFVP